MLLDVYVTEDKRFAGLVGEKRWRFLDSEVHTLEAVSVNLNNPRVYH